ncbi:unnamed protein product [Gemmata massiliana]|uniref:Uncharacterized protein n=1 Tax=Gemmata massiliana TaxID=1210884 RepID=A0A6P2D3R5_9BACT|nr:unnamed protein product [Gemmata massiliana]
MTENELQKLTTEHVGRTRITRSPRHCSSGASTPRSTVNRSAGADLSPSRTTTSRAELTLAPCGSRSRAWLQLSPNWTSRDCPKRAP